MCVLCIKQNFRNFHSTQTLQTRNLWAWEGGVRAVHIGCEMLINLQRMHTENFLILFNTDLRVARRKFFTFTWCMRLANTETRSFAPCLLCACFGAKFVCLVSFPRLSASHNINLHICHRLEALEARSKRYFLRTPQCNGKAKNVR